MYVPIFTLGLTDHLYFPELAIVPAVIVALTASSFLDSLDQWLNVLQAVQLPFAIIPVLLFTNNHAIMGRFKNHFFIQIVTSMLGLGE